MVIFPVSVSGNKSHLTVIYFEKKKQTLFSIVFYTNESPDLHFTVPSEPSLTMYEFDSHWMSIYSDSLPD